MMARLRPGHSPPQCVRDGGVSPRGGGFSAELRKSWEIRGRVVPVMGSGPHHNANWPDGGTLGDEGTGCFQTRTGHQPGGPHRPPCLS